MLVLLAVCWRGQDDHASRQLYKPKLFKRRVCILKYTKCTLYLNIKIVVHYCG